MLLILVTQRAPGEVESLARWRTGDRIILNMSARFVRHVIEKFITAYMAVR